MLPIVDFPELYIVTKKYVIRVQVIKKDDGTIDDSDDDKNCLYFLSLLHQTHSLHNIKKRKKRKEKKGKDNIHDRELT